MDSLTLKSMEVDKAFIPLNSLASMIIFVLLTPDLSIFKNSVDPDQMASEHLIRSSTLFSTVFVNTCFQRFAG